MGVDYYVSTDAGAADGNDGLTSIFTTGASGPWLTLARAVSNSVAADTIHIIVATIDVAQFAGGDPNNYMGLPNVADVASHRSDSSAVTFGPNGSLSGTLDAFAWDGASYNSYAVVAGWAADSATLAAQVPSYIAVCADLSTLYGNIGSNKDSIWYTAGDLDAGTSLPPIYANFYPDGVYVSGDYLSSVSDYQVAQQAIGYSNGYPQGQIDQYGYDLAIANIPSLILAGASITMGCPTGIDTIYGILNVSNLNAALNGLDAGTRDPITADKILHGFSAGDVDGEIPTPDEAAAAVWTRVGRSLTA